MPRVSAIESRCIHLVIHSGALGFVALMGYNVQDGSVQSMSVTHSPAVGATTDAFDSVKSASHSTQASDSRTVTRTAARTDQASPGLSSATLSAARKASDTLTDTRQASDAQTDSQAGAEEEEEEEAKAPDLAKVMAEILEFPEDLDGPNNPALLGLVEPINFDDTTQLQGMLSASSRLLRGPGRCASSLQFCFDHICR